MLVSRGRAVALTVLATLVVAGCGSSEGESSPDAGADNPSTSTSAPSTPTEDPAAQPGHRFTADPTIVGAHPVGFTSWNRVADDRIAVNFETGVPECYGMDATITETDTTVTVELRSGTRADSVDKMCVMSAVFATMELQLEKPLGDRQVLSAV